MWILVAQILVLTLAPVFTPTKDLSATVPGVIKGNTVKVSVHRLLLILNLNNNEVKRVVEFGSS